MLEEMNPWWYSDKWEREDNDIKSWEKNEIRWIPNWINNISLEPFSLNFVIGPRQVGKTTGLKLLIKKLIESGYDPKNIFYINCDLFPTLKELKEAVDYYLDKVDSGILILDEVTSLEYWWKIVKGYIDLGRFNTHVIIVSGSSSVKLFKFYEAFPGRRGKGRKINVLPLSFPDFLEVKGYKKYGYELRKAFSEYLNVGGFPRSINRDKQFSIDFFLSVDREITKIGKDFKLAREILYEVARKAPSALSYHSIASELRISHVTVREYLGLMEDLFILKIIYLKEGPHVIFRKEKKVMLRDPFIARSIFSLTGLEAREEILLEWVVQEHLLRKFGEIYYYKNNYEIDCIAGDLRIEIKKKAKRKHSSKAMLLDKDSIPEFLLNLFSEKNQKVITRFSF